nr:pseudouridine synthase [Ottowia thiooxydans]
MSELGLASRREADAWIERGLVRVNGEIARMGQQVSVLDQITVSKQAAGEQADRVTILLNKPMGYVSGQAEDGHSPAASLIGPHSHWSEDRSKTRFAPHQMRGLAPAGRLDIDSIGLLVLTQDGRIARHLIGQDSEIEKEYLVRVTLYDAPEAQPQNTQARVDPEKIALLRHGLQLDNQPLKPAKVSWQNEEQLRIVLREGKKRQIRRMCELVGLKVVGLKRVRIGSVALGQLPVGKWRYLAPGELF